MRKKTRPSSEPAGAGPGELRSYLERRRRLVDRTLPAHLPKAGECPPGLRRAMAYSLMAGGKRFRPILALAAAEACGGSALVALPAACALEFVHTYSLIHDDLPAMDDDDFRRGRPTSHRVFGEALAILAGDALLTRAFEILAVAGSLSPSVRAAQVRELARASGCLGMVGGQAADVAAEGRELSPVAASSINRKKTGALITASARLGALAAGAAPGALRRLTLYGRRLGEAFQVTDDILNVEGDLSRMGKKTGTDVRRGKATLPAIIGLEGARREAARLGREAKRALSGFGGRGLVLAGLVDFVLARRS